VRKIEQEQPCHGVPPAGDQSPRRDGKDHNEYDEMPRLWTLRSSNHGLSGARFGSQKGWVRSPQDTT
jgi:hypothetical protein